MKDPGANPVWKESSTIEFIGMTLTLPISIIIFNLIIGLVFRGFVPANPASTQIILINVLYALLGSSMAIYVYKLRKAFLLVLCSFVVIFSMYTLLMLAYRAASIGDVIENSMGELSWIYGTLVCFVLFFRYAEVRLNFAEALNTKELVEEGTNLKYDSGTCSRCGQVTVTAKEKSAGGAKKMVYFCDHCGMYIRGNPLTGTVLGIVLLSMTLIFIYAMNAGNERSASDTLNLLFLLFLYLGGRSLYLGVKSTLKAAGGK